MGSRWPYNYCFVVHKRSSLIGSSLLPQQCPECLISLIWMANKTEFTCFTHERAISNLSGRPLNLVGQFTYLGSNISSTESDLIIYMGKALTAINKLRIIWISDLSDEMKWNFFQAVSASVLLYIRINHLDSKEKHEDKATQENYGLFRTSPVINTPQISCCMATYLLSRKPFK